MYFLDKFFSYKHFLIKFHGEVDIYIPEWHVEYQFNNSTHHEVIHILLVGFQCYAMQCLELGGFLKYATVVSDLELNLYWNSFIQYKIIYKCMHQQSWQARNLVTSSKICISYNWTKISLWNLLRCLLIYKAMAGQYFTRRVKKITKL